MKVLLTRPQREACVLAARLAGRRGADGAPLEPIVFPALTIAPLADAEALAALDAALARLESYRLVVFVSPNAIDHALAHLSHLGRPWPSVVAVGVMGPGSVAALAAHGIVAPRCTVYAPGGLAAVEQGGPRAGDGSQGSPGSQGSNARYDSEALFATLDPATLAGARVLIVKGNGGRPWLAERLAAAGAAVDLVESYRREAPEPEPAARAAVLALVAGAEPAAVVVTSSEGLTHLRGLLARLAGAAGSAWLQTCTLYVPHARIAENATAAGLMRVVRTGPGDENIVRTLESQPLHAATHVP